MCIAVRAKSVFFFTHLYERHTTARAFKHSIAVSVFDGSDSPVPLAQNMSFFLVSQFWFIFLSKTQATPSPGCLSNPLKPEFLIPLLAFPAASIQPSLQVTDACLTLSKPLQTWSSVSVRITPSSSTCYPHYQGQCLPHSVTQHMSKWRHGSSQSHLLFSKGTTLCLPEAMRITFTKFSVLLDTQVSSASSSRILYSLIV